MAGVCNLMATATSGLSLHSGETACLNRNFVLATISGFIVLFAMMAAMSHLSTYPQLAHGIMGATAAASGYGTRECYVFSATGTRDLAYQALTAQIKCMKTLANAFDAMSVFVV